MNVQELIDALEKVVDKDSLVITLSDDGTEESLLGVARSVYAPLIILVTEKAEIIADPDNQL